MPETNDADFSPGYANSPAPATPQLICLPSGAIIYRVNDTAS